MKTRIKLSIALVPALLVWTTMGFAHSEHFTKNAQSPQKSYEFRTSVMTIYKWYLSPMGAMVKGKVKFDAKAFAESAKGLETASSMNLLQGFPSESSEDEIDDSDAKPKIWKNFEDFEKKYKSLQIEAKALAKIAKQGDENAIKAQFKKTAASCGTCHKAYKTK